MNTQKDFTQYLKGANDYILSYDEINLYIEIEKDVLETIDSKFLNCFQEDNTRLISDLVFDYCYLKSKKIKDMKIFDYLVKNKVLYNLSTDEEKILCDFQFKQAISKLRQKHIRDF